MKWTIVIPTWKRAKALAVLLGELAGQSTTDFEVVVVSDGEDAHTRKLAETYAGTFSIRWIFHAENRGLAAARNTGAEAAGGDYLLFLDDDVIPSPDLIAKHDDEHSSARSVAVIGRIIEERQTPFVSKTDEYMQQSWESSLAEALPREGASEILSVGAVAEDAAWFGLNCSMERTLFQRVGGFDAKLRSDEELELGVRLYRLGVQSRYASEAVVYHRGSKDMSQYYPACWRRSGELDVYRAREKGERSKQISRLTDLESNGPIRCGLAKIGWDYSGAILKGARSLERLTNATGSRKAFAAWARLRHLGEYWQAVRETGITREGLSEMAGAEPRILMLHSLAKPRNEVEASYYLSPERFRRFLAWLELKGFSHVGAEQFLGQELPERNVLLTFDDAYDDLYDELLPLISRFKLKPLVFVVADLIGKTNAWDSRIGLRERSLLTLEQMLEMQRAGVTFGSHSLMHPMVTSLSDDDLRRELRDSKLKLEDLLGTEVKWFAYPYGDVNRRVRVAVQEVGYKAAVTTDAGSNRWQDPLVLNRLDINDGDWLIDFACKIRTGRDYRKSILRRLPGVQATAKR